MSNARKQQRRLGRGLSSLIDTPVRVDAPSISPTQPTVTGGSSVSTSVPAGDSGSDGPVAAGGGLVEIALGAIVPSPFQPRRLFDEAAIEELAGSIRRSGLMQPIIVRPVGPGRYELVAGERRWRAAGRAGLERLPALVRDLDDETSAEWALVENVQRADLDPMERAEAYRALIDRFALTQADVAERVGVDRSSVANALRLLELEPEIRAMLSSGALSAGHGKALCGMVAGGPRVALAQRAAKESWTVRRLEREVKSPTPARPPTPGRALSAEVRDLEKQLGGFLGTRVRVRTGRDGTRGTVQIEFYDLDHFDGLMARIGFSPDDAAS